MRESCQAKECLTPNYILGRCGGQGKKHGDQLGGCCLIQTGDDGLDRKGSGGGREKGSESGSIIKAEQPEFSVGKICGL